MASNWERQLQQLETATSRDIPAGMEMDVETSELREGWTALVRLLEEADRETPIPELTVSRRPGGSRYGIGWIVVVATLAASVLIAFTVGWHFAGRSRTPITETPVEAPGEKTLEVVAVEPNESAPPAGSMGKYGWDDDLDDSFEQLTQQIASFHGSGYVTDSPYGALDDRIESLREKMDEL